MRHALVRKVVGITAVVAAAGGVGVAIAAPATSATAHCGYSRVFYGSVYDMRLPTISSTNHSYACQLSYGDSGEGVRTLQWILNKCYGAGLTIDKQFGSKTRAALQRVQNAEGVDDDGIYGSDTRAAMKVPKYIDGQYIHCGDW